MCYSCILLMLIVLALLSTLMDIRHEHAASMKWDLLYNVSANVRHLVGSRDGHMTWTTVDESAVSSDPVTVDSQTNDVSAEDTGSSGLQDLNHPPNARLLVEAFSYKPGAIKIMDVFVRDSHSCCLCISSVTILSRSLVLTTHTYILSPQEVIVCELYYYWWKSEMQSVS